MLVLTFISLVVGASVDECGSLRVGAAYSVRIEETKQPLAKLVLHPSGAVAASWLGQPEYWIRQWSEPIDREDALLKVWGRVRELLPDGRLVVQRMIDEGSPGKIVLDVADWGGGARVIARAQNLDLLGVAAVACALPPSEVKRGHAHDWVACVGGRLIAERPISRSASGNTDGLFLWDQGNWRQIATSSDSLLPSEIGVPRLLVADRVEPTVLKALETAGIPFLVLPFAARRATCGPDSCWGVTQDGRLMALDLRAGSEGAWVEVGSGVAKGGLITLRVASKARALLHHDACNRQVRYFQLPAPSTLGQESRHVWDAGVR